MTVDEQLAAFEAALRRGQHPVIARFVATESPNAAVLVVSHAMVRRLLCVWPQVVVRPTRPADEGPPHGDGRATGDVWAWLWSGHVVDVADLAAKMGVEIDSAMRTLSVALGGRLVYPDGTIHRYAEGVLQAILVRAAGQAAGEGKRRGASR